MEVHAPDHAIHTWREFLVHMGTICLGLLIAIGLEQTVEWMHRRHETAELRRELAEDTTAAIEDARNTEDVHASIYRYLIQVRRDARKAMDTPGPIVLQPLHRGTADEPMEPTWMAAKASGEVSLLSPLEVKAYSEVDDNMTLLRDQFKITNEARQVRQDIQSLYITSAHDHAVVQFDKAHDDALRAYVQALTRERDAEAVLVNDCLQLEGSEQAIQQGHLSLRQVQAAERERIAFYWKHFILK